MAIQSILLIDRDPSVRAVLQFALVELGGWEVTAIASPQDGLALLHQQQPDVIVMDFSPSRNDSLRLLQALREDGCYPPIPVVITTTRPNWLSPQQLQDLGIAGAIAKPFYTETLHQQLLDILASKLPNSDRGMQIAHAIRD